MLIIACGINVLSQLAGAVQNATAHPSPTAPQAVLHHAGDMNSVVTPLPGTAASFGALADRLDEQPKPRSTCVLVSSISDAPKIQLAALELARSYLDTGRVVLIDGHFGEAGIAGHIGLAQHPGFSELIAGAIDYEKIVHRDPRSRLHIIPAGKAVADPLIAARSSVVDAIIDSLAYTYQAIVIVAPPINVAPESLALARFARQAVLLVGDDASPQVVERAHQRLLEAGVAEVLDYDVGEGPRLHA